jgi:hypothetical protein
MPGSLSSLSVIETLPGPLYPAGIREAPLLEGEAVDIHKLRKVSCP